MLKQIDPKDVELGMFIHRLEGNWFSHPFWKSRFLLTEPARLELLRTSSIPGVIIDTERGRDLGEPLAAPPPRAPAATPATPRKPAPRSAYAQPAPPSSAQRQTAGEQGRPTQSLAPRSLAREFGQASRIAERSQRVVSRLFFEARLGKTIKPGLVEPVINDILASVQRNHHAFNGLMRCKQSSEHLYHHALAASALMISLGRKLRLPPDMLRQAGLAGLLQDVGIGHLPVPLASHHGDHRLIPPEIMRDHVRLGYGVVVAGGLPDAVAKACLQHHERMDGAGYPQGLTGPAIGVLGRMAAICDTYDELVNGDGRASGLDPAAAIERMRDEPGAYDAAMLDSFIEAVGVYPIGSVVALRSGRLAMVVDQYPGDIARPKVRAFYSLVTGGMITPVEIALATCQGEDAIEGTVSPEAYGIPDMAVLREKLFLAACAGG
jgi:HD-GYP domain-containing protein (c-di-GMP phosphodiesterase class II)